MDRLSDRGSIPLRSTIRISKSSVYAGLRGIEIGENIDFYCFDKMYPID